MPKLIAANAVQGAILRGVRAGSDHYTRAAFSRATGVWPGEEKPDEAKLCSFAVPPVGYRSCGPETTEV